MHTNIGYRQGARGFHSDIIIIDEYMYLPPEVLYENALIMLIVKNRTLYVMSSAGDWDSDRMQLLRKICAHTQKPYFRVLYLGTVCDACTAGKIVPCPHLLDNRSTWKTLESEQMLKDLMPPAYYRTEVHNKFIRFKYNIHAGAGRAAAY